MSFSSYDLCGPDPKPMTRREVDALKQLCVELPRNPTIVQIGADIGVSTMAMLEARPDSFIFSIDVKEAGKERDHLQKAGLPWARVVRGLGKSQDIARFWPGHWMCDMLYIDGDHRRPGIDQDIRFWMPFIEIGGIIAFHDYILPSERGPHVHGRVYEAVEELIGDSLPTLLYVGRVRAYRVNRHAT